MSAIQSFIEKVSNSDDFPSRVGSITCKRKSRYDESSVGKIAGLIHALHEDASIRTEMDLGMQCCKEGRLGEMNVYPPIDVPTRLSTVAGPLIESIKAYDFFEMSSKPIEIMHID